MDFVDVGNTGNSGDPIALATYGTAYGAVDYAYRIGTYEVTEDQFAAAATADPSIGWAGAWSGDQPAAHVTLIEAKAFADWLTDDSGGTGYYASGSALSHLDYAAANGLTYFVPTVDEWYKAAYHQNDGATANYWLYPTASDTAPTGEAPPGTDMTNGSVSTNRNIYQ